MKRKLLGLDRHRIDPSSLSPGLAELPERPITIVVYLKPGGAGDVFARRFAKIAAKYTNAQLSW